MTQQKITTAITPTREQDFSEWYQQAIKAADLAENSPVRGCMVIKPWGYAIWEHIRDTLDRRIKETDHQNVYFPLFIPLSFLQKEADHVEGFAKECAVVTHHRLETKDGKLVPAGELPEPIIVRPTSETIIGESFSRWIESYRDLPLKINQWANVVRWEMRPRIFLRTSEFLWQEGHTAHATYEEAQEETMQMLNVYRELYEEYLAIPVIAGEKSIGERFPGADHTYTLEAMMQDRKALQGCTSHNLGQNFSKAQNIKFNAQDSTEQFVYTTSWGFTTRTIGALIMVHGDDDGIRLPPRIAPKQVVIIPIIPKDELKEEILQTCKKLEKDLKLAGVRVHLDVREMRGGEKGWEWIKKGVPLRIEVGPKDLEKGEATLYRRDAAPKSRLGVPFADLTHVIPPLLEEIQQNYFNQAKAYLDGNTRSDVKTLDELKRFFAEEAQGGFLRVNWYDDASTEEMLKPLGLTIRCLPLVQSGEEGTCIVTGRPTRTEAIIAKSY
jgi:prolyl-tRNA synthetase